MSLNKSHNLKVNPGAKPARFVINLKQDSVEPEIPEKVKLETRLEEKIEKFAAVDWKGKLKAGMSKINFRIAKPEIASPPRAASNDILDQLLFVGLAKLLFFIFKKLFGWFLKICYALGWVIMFLLRLVYLAVWAAIKPLAKKSGYLFIRFQATGGKIIHDLPSGYQATYSVLMPLFVRLLRLPAQAGSLWSLAMTKEISYQREVKRLKPALVFAGVLLIIILPVKAFTYYKSLDNLKGKVLGASETALNDLISGGQAATKLDFKEASKNFSAAGDSFLKAQNQLNEINGLIFSLASLAPDKNIQLAAAGRHLVKAGRLSASAGENLSQALSNIFSPQSGDMGQILMNLSHLGRLAITDLNQLSDELNQINSQILPENQQVNFITLKQKTVELSRGLNEFIGLADNLQIFLGLNADKRYLLVFQNNAELRASGGFIGSFAVVDFSRGKIKNLEAPGGGSYDTEAGLLKKIKAPQPLSLVRADWHFWDANWWPDWPTSARQLAWFYENSDGSTVDGVIGFTPVVMEKLLKVIGPIDLRDKYDLVFNADNFWLETQKLSEQKPDVTKQPKKIIGDLMNKIMEELPKRLNQDNLPALLKIMEESLNDKNILFYFSDPELQNQAAQMGWDGKIKDTAGDYLNVVNTNIAGGKSDRKISQQIILQTQIQADGTIINNLTIKRTHNGVKREPFIGVRNVDWLRVYVPEGSKLISAAGFKPVDKIFFKAADSSWQNDPQVLAAENSALTDEPSGTKIYDELGKTVFANWSQLDPGQAVEINLKYELPFKLMEIKPAADQSVFDQLINQAGEALNQGQKKIYSYSLLVQKQPGMNSSVIISQLKLNDNFQPLWRYPDDLAVNQAGWYRSEALEQDKIIAALMEEK